MKYDLKKLIFLVKNSIGFAKSFLEIGLEASFSCICSNKAYIYLNTPLKKQKIELRMIQLHIKAYNHLLTILESFGKMFNLC